MKNIELFNIEKQPVWTVEISDCPNTGLSREIESSGLLLLDDVIRLRTKIFLKDVQGNRLPESRYPAAEVLLNAFNDSRGPFINPSTGVRVYPDQNNKVPNNTVLRYAAIMALLQSPTVVGNLVISFVQSADLNGEFNI